MISKFRALAVGAVCVVALYVVADAQQIARWISTGTGLTTAGTVSVTSNSANALTVPNGGAGGTWTFTGGRTNFDNATPLVYFNNTNASANNRKSRFIVNSGQFAYQMLDDAEASSGTVFTVDRSAHTPTLWTSHVPMAIRADSSSKAVDLLGRASDNVSQIGFTDNANSVQYAALIGLPGGFVLRAGGVDHGFTSGGVAFGGPLGGVRIDTQSAQPGFLAYNSSTDAAVPASTNTTVEFDTETTDPTNSFASNTFTAPVAGDYRLCYGVTFTVNSFGTFSLLTTGATYQQSFGALVAQRSESTCVEAPMSAGHTARLEIFPNATTNIAGTNGGARTTYFSGRLMP